MEKKRTLHCHIAMACYINSEQSLVKSVFQVDSLKSQLETPCGLVKLSIWTALSTHKFLRKAPRPQICKCAEVSIFTWIQPRSSLYTETKMCQYGS